MEGKIRYYHFDAPYGAYGVTLKGNHTVVGFHTHGDNTHAFISDGDDCIPCHWAWEEPYHTEEDCPGQYECPAY